MHIKIKVFLNPTKFNLTSADMQESNRGDYDQIENKAILQVPWAFNESAGNQEKPLCTRITVEQVTAESPVLHVKAFRNY